MKNLSVDCDCCAVAEDPCMKDIGILASLDPVAIDQACIDLVVSSDDPGKEHFMERVNEPQRHPHHRGRRGPGLRHPGIRADRAVTARS